MNSKGGFNHCSIPRLSVVVGDKEYKERPSPEITDTEVETILTVRGQRARVREAGDNQALPRSL